PPRARRQRTSVQLRETRTAELDETARHSRPGRGRTNEMPFRGPARESEQAVQPFRRQTAGAAERQGGIGVRRRDDLTTLRERRLDFPPQPKRQIRRVEEQQQSRR